MTARKVVFLANGGLFGNGQARMEVEVMDNTKVSRPTHSAPTRKDHELVNWTLNGAVYNFETPVTADIELVAQWKVNTSKTQHKVVFMAYGGKPEPEMQTVVDGAQVNRPADPVKNGFRFAGWNSNGSRYDFNAQVKKDLVLEAQWEANPGVTEVKVVFLANGGLFANGKERIEVGVARGETVNPPTQGISRADFTLEGWTLKGEEYDFTKPVMEDIELAALWKPTTGVTVYRVVFMAQGGRPEPPMQLVKSGEKAQQPADPAKEGFTFQWWKKRGGAKYSFTETVTQDIVLDAQWQDNTPAIKKYTVVFVANGGTFADGNNRMEFKVAEGSRVEAPAKPSRIDFTFSGWMLRGAAYDFTRPVKEDLVLEAQWIADPNAETYTVTFMANGGTPEPLAQIVKKGEKAQEPKDVKKEGYTLKGWTKDGSAKYDFTVTSVNENIVLYAMWQKESSATVEHTVVFMANGGTFADGKNRMEFQVAAGTLANRPTDPVYEGFTFMGWTLNGAPYTFTEPVTADIVLVAQWKANQGVKAYRVVFMALGGTPEPPVQLVAEGKPAQQPVDPAKDGFTFQGWTLEGAAYAFTEPVTKDIVLRAKWQANPGVTERTVTFMALGGAFADGSDVQKITVKDGGTVLEPTAPVKEGYTLTGWTKGGSTKYNFADAVNADLVLYAMWQKESSATVEHTVVFVANGGTFADGKNRMEFQVADGTVLMQPEKPTRADFTFGGWMLRGAEYDFTRPVKEDLVLEARWIANSGVETFTVTFMANGGAPEPLVQTVKNGEKAQEPKDVKKEGFKLKGWTLDGAAYDFTTAVTANIVLKAQWEKKDPSMTTHVVTYMANGGKFADGSERMGVEVENGKLANRPTDPEKVGYAFTGWNLNGAEYDFTKPVTSDIELEAQWEENASSWCTVHFMALGGEPQPEVQNLQKGEKAQEPALNPAKEGFTFKGWTKNGAAYNFADPVTESIVLKAKWQVNSGVTERTVTFMALGGKFADGSDVMVFTVQDGKSVSRPQDDPIKEGFTLQGWTLNGEAYDFTTAVTKDIVLKAQWVKKDPSVKEHTVTFMALGGKFADGSDVQSFTVKNGEAVLEPTAPVKEGFTLQGWTLEGVPYSFTAAVKNDIVLKAAWEANSGVTEHEVTFMALGGKFADGSDVQSFTVKDGEAVLEPTAPKKEGYSLTGWTKDGSAEYNFTTPVTADLVLYAMWKKEDPSVKEHTVTFMALGGAFADGTDVQSFTVKDGEAVLEPMAPEKEGFTFRGWTLNGETYDFSKAVTKDIVLKAQWEKRDPSMTEHKVTFMALGGAFADGSDVQSFTVKDGEPVLRPTAPVKEGYTLKGWTKDGNEEYEFGTSVREDIVLYAVWEKEDPSMTEHTVVFVANGGTFADGKERLEFKVADGKTVLKPTAPVKAGSFFSGWWTQGGAEYDFSQPVTADLELEARWESREHTVSFMALGGRPEPQAQRVVHGNKATRPQVDPSKEGFTFQEWTLNDVAYNFSDTVKESIVLKAKWQVNSGVIERTVTFMALGGKFADGSDVMVFTVQDGKSVLRPQDDPIKEGFTLQGWTLDGAAYDFTVAVTKDIVLKAQWEKENPGMAERTVTFMALGGAFADGSDVQTFTVKAGEAVLEPTAPVKEGYTLKGWTKDRSVQYDFTVAVTEDIVLYAMWKKNTEVTKEHTVTFMALGGAFADGTDVQSFTVKDGATVRKPQDPAKKGFTFQGWTLDGAPYGFTEAVTKDIVLKAQWEKVDPNMTEYTVTFMALGGAFADGSDVQSFTVKAGETVLEPTAPVKEGYTLKGWKKANGAGYNFGDRVNADLVLYAVWEKKDGVTVEHKVVFVATGGTFADGKNRMKFKVADGAVLTQPEKPTRADFTFRRWMLRGAAYDFAQPVKEDLVLEAQWIANSGVETFTVTFMANGGAPEPLAQIVKKDGTAQEPIDVKKEGFKLKGWTLNGAAYDFTTAVTADIVLKAQWEKKDPSMATHVVTYVANGGKFADGSDRMEIEVAAGTLANRPTDPVKKGSALTGWTLDRAPYGFTEPVTKDIELEAQWASSEHTVSFMALGGEPEPQEQRVEHGEKAKRPQDDPRKEGFTFQWWTLGGAK
ncbi:MAG: InlB B-repeat-containing protein [Bacteroidia bacterium]|nr:InlB B-repeat-containing protein [Bacteroidia bacterium]